MSLPTPNADQAFAAARELRAIVQKKQRTLTLYQTKFPDPGRIPAEIKYESEELVKELALLTPTLLYLEEIGGKGQAPTLS